ncbi:MAG: sugar phosphate isomerase/epimerase [Candidatus Omnitrophica bacterium]|nr:sugar phosphate isomerase/epimerase [Candidatus Omnitrophota bacterium]MCA9414787.1 sugar phosphate isomerase/epimerase [Candidatus Omnitrophota bacterium]MCA9430177.1 sugar phosphate isomerase/epimerase [Candidatus Omnitrophota bacterium]MCA9437786.1 sugar phosphate isomerase/epimerase [Candidatus Omnitrophota bacterium]MCA9443917.1 sugar phosphate isomerase/epimerase [Candidatus Omnitrophota bacterium]
MERRDFVKTAGIGAIAATALSKQALAAGSGDKKFRISIAAWSMHKAFFAGEMTMMQQPEFCASVGVHGLELVNRFFESPQYGYLQKFLKVCEDNDVKPLLIMCDDEGDMAAEDKKFRMQSAKNHHKWVDIAEVLGCHSIRCNSGHGQAGDKDAVKRAAESFSELCDYAAQAGINVIIENHGGLSSHPEDLISLMKAVGKPNFGTLPDFGNFPDDVNKYDAVREMMPYAKAVSAKCYDFDDKTGVETKIDYEEMMKIVLDSGYDAWVGIEYEGPRLSERDGVIACKKLLERFQ